jgi:hypothetical protein
MMRFTIPKINLPDYINQKDFLNQYFSGKLANIAISESHYHIDLSWPEEASFYIDPVIEKGLNWWSHNMRMLDVPFAVKQKIKYQLSLNDNWTLYSWSKWLKNSSNNKIEQPAKLIILHIDDHTDCMSPLLFMKSNNIYSDPLSGTLIDVCSPDSIKIAIGSGAITIGSFMTPFLHRFAEVELRHLMPTHRIEEAIKYKAIVPTFAKDDFLCLNCLRPILVFKQGSAKTNVFYQPSDNLSKFLKDIPTNVPILLHVDMDYFNNRYDGDSDWQYHDYIHDPDERDVLVNIRNVFKTIFNTIPSNQIEDISISLSPGFFPSEYWARSVEIIDEFIN